MAPWVACRCARWVANITVMRTAVLRGVLLPAHAHIGAPSRLLGAAGSVLGVEAFSRTAGPEGTSLHRHLCPFLPGMLPRLQTSKPEGVLAAGQAWLRVGRSRSQSQPSVGAWASGLTSLSLAFLIC